MKLIVIVFASLVLAAHCQRRYRHFLTDGTCALDIDCASHGLCHNGQCLYPRFKTPAIPSTSPPENEKETATPSDSSEESSTPSDGYEEYDTGAGNAVGKTSDQEDPADPEDPDETVYPDEPEYPDGNRYRDTDSQLPNEGEEETEAPAAQEEESTTENHSEEDGQTGDDEETTVVANESGEQSTTEVPPEEDYEDYTDKMPEGRAWTGTLLPPGPDDYYAWPRRSSR